MVHAGSPTPEQQIEFLVKIHPSILRQAQDGEPAEPRAQGRAAVVGGFVATYKFALLQALADLSVEKSEFSEVEPRRACRAMGYVNQISNIEN